jgi:peptidase E
MGGPPTIVTLGGGGFSMEPDNLALDAYVLSRTGKDRPRVAFVPTASGDSERYALNFFRAFARLPCVPSLLPLFQREAFDLRAFVLAQDAVYVGGGNTANLLAVWRLHGLDAILREAWERGVVLAGISAGSICWFEAGTTDSFGPTLRALHGALGFLPGSHCPHYDGEAQRRPLYRRLVAEGALPDGWACDDGAAIRWEGTEPAEFVASRPSARAWRVRRTPEGAVEEEVVPRVLDRVDAPVV